MRSDLCEYAGQGECLVLARKQRHTGKGSCPTHFQKGTGAYPPENLSYADRRGTLAPQSDDPRSNRSVWRVCNACVRCVQIHYGTYQARCEVLRTWFRRHYGPESPRWAPSATARAVITPEIKATSMTVSLNRTSCLSCDNLERVRSRTVLPTTTIHPRAQRNQTRNGHAGVRKRGVTRMEAEWAQQNYP